MTRELSKQYLVTSITVICLLLAAIFAVPYIYPVHLCNKWGGTLYSDGQCYPIKTMDKCVDIDGKVKYSSARISYDLYKNISGTHETLEIK